MSRGRLLVVSWALPPIRSPRSVQVARTMRGLAENGWQLNIIAADGRSLPGRWPLDDSLLAHYPDAGVVARLQSKPCWPVAGRVFALFQQRPDAFRGWAMQAVEAGRRMAEQQPFDALITFAQPWSSHLAGLLLARQLRLPWIAHFSDPWTDVPSYYRRHGRLAKQANIYLERQVVEQADALVFVTGQARDLVMRKFPPSWKEKTHVVSHAWDAQLPKGCGADAAKHPCRLLYTGSLDGSRSIEPLCAALDALRRQQGGASLALSIRFVGAIGSHAGLARSRFQLEDVLRIEPPVSFAESLKQMRSADALLLLDAPSESTSSPFLASKVMEYVAARLPILGLTPVNSPSGLLLRQLGCPVVAPDDAAGIAAALQSLLQQHCSGSLGLSAQFDAAAAAYESRSVAGQWDALLDALISHRAHSPSLQPVEA